MFEVRVFTCTNQALHRLRAANRAAHDEIGRRALRLFRERGCRCGHDLDDWLEAESQVLYSPDSKLAEAGNEMRITAVVPGVDPRTLEVDVLPNSITIEGQVGQKRLLHQYALPAVIDPDEVRAILDHGVLEIRARKLVPKEKIAGAAAA